MTLLGAYRPHPAISLLFDIGQGAGLAGATGVRPFLPPLAAGALARGDLGLDFEGTGYEFLEEPAFLLGILGVAVLSYALTRGGALAQPLRAGTWLLALGLGALLFAGSLADGGHEDWPGLLAGAACAATGALAAAALLGGARRRLDRSAASFLPAYADAAALVLAGLAILLPPLGLVALAALGWVAVGGRRREGGKFEGLRILR